MVSVVVVPLWPTSREICSIGTPASDSSETKLWRSSRGATEDQVSPGIRQVYRKLRLPDSDIRVLLQKTDDEKTSKERMHLDLETDDVEAEVRRLEALGATRWDHQKERGFDFWVMRDPWLNEFVVLQPEFPELLAQRTPWPQ
jgi:Glyoxalase-like domain